MRISNRDKLSGRLAIKTGDVGVVRRYLSWNPVSWVSAIVRFFTGTRWNHTIIFVRIDTVGLFVVEAVESGVSMCRYERWVEKYDHDLKVIRIKNTKPVTTLDILNQVGKPYDYTSLIFHQVKYQVKRWFSKNPKWSGRTGPKASEKLYCSELVAYLYNFPHWYSYTTAGIEERPHEVIAANYDISQRAS